MKNRAVVSVQSGVATSISLRSSCLCRILLWVVFALKLVCLSKLPHGWHTCFVIYCRPTTYSVVEGSRMCLSHLPSCAESDLCLLTRRNESTSHSSSQISSNLFSLTSRSLTWRAFPQSQLPTRDQSFWHGEAFIPSFEKLWHNSSPLIVTVATLPIWRRSRLWLLPQMLLSCSVLQVSCCYRLARNGVNSATDHNTQIRSAQMKKGTI